MGYKPHAHPTAIPSCHGTYGQNDRPMQLWSYHRFLNGLVVRGVKPYASGTIGVESPDPPERAVPLRRSEALPLFFLCALAGLADYLWSM